MKLASWHCLRQFDLSTDKRLILECLHHVYIKLRCKIQNKYCPSTKSLCQNRGSCVLRSLLVILLISIMFIVSFPSFWFKIRIILIQMILFFENLIQPTIYILWSIAHVTASPADCDTNDEKADNDHNHCNHRYHNIQVEPVAHPRRQIDRVSVCVETMDAIQWWCQCTCYFPLHWIVFLAHAISKTTNVKQYTHATPNRHRERGQYI